MNTLERTEALAQNLLPSSEALTQPRRPLSDIEPGEIMNSPASRRRKSHHVPSALHYGPLPFRPTFPLAQVTQLLKTLLDL